MHHYPSPRYVHIWTMQNYAEKYSSYDLNYLFYFQKVLNDLVHHNCSSMKFPFYPSSRPYFKIYCLILHVQFNRSKNCNVNETPYLLTFRIIFSSLKKQLILHICTRRKFGAWRCNIVQLNDSRVSPWITHLILNFHWQDLHGQLLLARRKLKLTKRSLGSYVFRDLSTICCTWVLHSKFNGGDQHVSLSLDCIRWRSLS